MKPFYTLIIFIFIYWRNLKIIFIFFLFFLLFLLIYLFSKLAGKTLFITGASRGIGKYIALKAARDGANVAIVAKTAEPHPKLPGTVYTAAQEGEYHFTFSFFTYQYFSFISLQCRITVFLAV